MEHVESTSLDLTKLNIEKLKELFPNVVTEGKIDFDMLRTVLGDEVDETKEKYQFTWNGKQEAIKIAQSPSTATLRPCKGKSKDWNSTENLYIEGDNLEVLKQLQKTYYGKIKMIYIDPPYNSGKDFVYHDDFKNTIENYKEQTEQGMSSNPETNGRYHTDWLNMMYPRLLLAKNLLKEDGVIFASIDEKECQNLRKIFDEIYGEKNYIGDLVWEATTQPINAGSAKFGLQKKTESILMYAKNKNEIKGFTLEEMEGTLSYPHHGKHGACRFEIIEKSDAGDYSRATMKFSILGQYPRDGKRWQIGEVTARQLEKDGKVEIVDGIVKKAIYPEDELDKRQFKPFWSLLTAESVGTAQTGKNELNKLMEKPIGFDTVKPTALIKKLLSYLGDEYIVLDFFSGSATTAHAVMKLNVEDSGKRKFIMVQFPEKCDEKSDAFKAGYKNICEIGEKRILLAGEQIKEEWLKENTSVEVFSSEQKEIPSDIGFKVFTLDSTNIKPWDNELIMDETTLFNYSSEVFKEGRTNEDILYEIMLKYGVFDEPVAEIEVNGKTMYRVGKRHMMVCLDDKVSNEDIKAIGELSPRVVIFKESGFKNDNDKINAVYNLEKAGIEDVKCI